MQELAIDELPGRWLDRASRLEGLPVRYGLESGEADETSRTHTLQQ